MKAGAIIKNAKKMKIFQKRACKKSKKAIYLVSLLRQLNE